MVKNSPLNQEFVDSIKWISLVSKFRNFMSKQGFLEVSSHTNDLEIIAACENHKAIASTTLGGKKLPLPQTAQMLLEFLIFLYTLLKKNISKIWTQSISYRDEDITDDGRHLRLFSMFEVEALGSFIDMTAFLNEFAQEFFGSEPYWVSYERALELCGNTTGVLTEDDETTLFTALENILGKEPKVIALHNFPQESNPYFNMERNADGTAIKVDLLVKSKSTGKALEIGGFAKRCSDRALILKRFIEQTEGEYAKTLHKLFGMSATQASL